MEWSEKRSKGSNLIQQSWQAFPGLVLPPPIQMHPKKNTRKKKLMQQHFPSTLHYHTKERGIPFAPFRATNTPHNPPNINPTFTASTDSSHSQNNMSFTSTKCLAKKCAFEGSCTMFVVEGNAPPGVEIPLSAKCICGCFRNQHQQEVRLFQNKCST